MTELTYLVNYSCMCLHVHAVSENTHSNGSITDSDFSKDAFHSHKGQAHTDSPSKPLQHSRLDSSLSLQQQKHLFIALRLSVLNRDVSRPHGFIRCTVSSALVRKKTLFIHLLVV